MWGQKDSTLTIFKTVDTSGLMLQTALDSNTEKRSPENNCTLQYL